MFRPPPSQFSSSTVVLYASAHNTLPRKGKSFISALDSHIIGEILHEGGNDLAGIACHLTLVHNRAQSCSCFWPVAHHHCPPHPVETHGLRSCGLILHPAIHKPFGCFLPSDAIVMPPTSLIVTFFSDPSSCMPFCSVHEDLPKETPIHVWRPQGRQTNAVLLYCLSVEWEP